MEFTDREMRVLKVAREKLLGARHSDFVEGLVSSKRTFVDGTHSTRPAEATTKPTLSKDLRNLLARGILRYEPPRKPGARGLYIHVISEAFRALAVRGWADSTLEELERDPDVKRNPGARLSPSDYRRWIRAIRIRRSIDDEAVRRFLDAVARAGRL